METQLDTSQGDGEVTLSVDDGSGGWRVVDRYPVPLDDVLDVVASTEVVASDQKGVKPGDRVLVTAYDDCGRKVDSMTTYAAEYSTAHLIFRPEGWTP